jgi:chromosome segregation ATPase
MTPRALSLALALAVGLAPCLGCRSAWYSTMEAFGVHKRDLLVDRVEEARDAQADAKQQFTDALEAFRSVQDFDGGDLEELYDRLADQLERSETRVDDVRGRVRDVERVADDLFEEWERESERIQDAELRRRDEELLQATRQRCDALVAAMRKAESKMEPVLVRFRDQVLYLKHNLNARAVASLSGTLAGIEGDVGELIAEMEASIAEADAFLASMEEP